MSFLAVMALLAVLPSQADQKTGFSGTETFTGQFIDFGKVTCPGHEPGQWPPTPCPPGSRIQLRGLVRVWSDSMTDPRASGTNTTTENWSFDENLVGPMWGTFRLDVSPDSFWEGIWTGEWKTTSGKTRVVGHGGGALEGLQIRYECDYPSGAGGTCTGQILDFKSK